MTCSSDISLTENETCDLKLNVYRRVIKKVTTLICGPLEHLSGGKSPVLAMKMVENGGESTDCENAGGGSPGFLQWVHQLHTDKIRSVDVLPHSAVAECSARSRQARVSTPKHHKPFVFFMTTVCYW